MKVIWAFDPFDQKLPVASMAKFLNGMCGERAELQPVYVASLSQRESRLQDPGQVDALISAKLARVAADHEPPEVLWENSRSDSAAVEKLLRHAVTEGAALVAAFTHGRRGLQHFYRGSFAEGLVFSSRLPILVVNPDFKMPARVRRVIFSTDFTTGSLKSLETCADLAKSLGWEVIVFHASDPYLTGSAPGAARYQQLLKKNTALAERITERAGVKARVITDNRFKLVSELVVETAKEEKCELICVSSGKSKSKRVLLGSISRQVLRQSPLPVLSLPQ